MEQPIIETRQLVKYFQTRKGQLHAVDGVNLSIPKGKTLGVVGESGCGKSTLGRTILRLVEPTSGEILLNGKNIVGCSKQEMKKIRMDMQIIFQDPYSSIDPRMTVSELIAEPIHVCHTLKHKDEIEAYVVELMRTVGLSERLINTYPHELDGGRRQRIGVARALALKPTFIVCDEPVSALDVSIQAQILNLMMDLQDDQSLTYMFISHDLSVVRHISDHIMVMYLGQCVESAPADELFENPRHPYTKALLEAIPVPSLDARDQEWSTIRGEVTSPVNPAPGCRFAARCPYATDQCRGHDIPYNTVSEGHNVACVLCN